MLLHVCKGIIHVLTSMHVHFTFQSYFENTIHTMVLIFPRASRLHFSICFFIILTLVELLDVFSRLTTQMKAQKDVHLFTLVTFH